MTARNDTETSPTSPQPNNDESRTRDVRGRPGALRKFWLAAATAFAVGGLGWWFRSHTTPLREVPQSNFAHVSQDVQELMQKTRQNVIDDPGSADAWGQLGMVLLAYEFDRDAVPCFQNAAVLAPDEFRWHYFLGLATTAINRDTAIHAFQKAKETKPGDPWTLARLGELHLANGSLADAQSCFESAIKASARPTARTLQALARTLLARGELEAAREAAADAVGVAPNSRMALEVLAQVQHRLKDPAAAATLARIQEFPDHPLPWEDPHAGYVLAQRLASSSAEDRVMEAARSGNIAAAIEAGERALRDTPDNQSVALRLSELYAEAGDVQRAISVLGEELLRHPNQAELHFRLGIMRTLQEDWAKASECFRKATQLSADYVLAWYNLGQCLIKLDRQSDAISAFEEAVRMAPEHKAARINLVRLLQQQNELTASGRHLVILLEIAPDDPEVLVLVERHNALSAKASRQN